MAPASPAKPLIASFGIVALGILIALGTVLSVTLVRPVLIYFAFGAIVLLLPTLMVREPRAYWLFLLAVSIPFNIAKRTTEWLVDPRILLNQFGTGTISLDVYLTDVVLFLLLLPWLARLCLRRESLYFPKIGYIFLFYLAWALIVALVEAKSLYRSIFEWSREILYFLSFVYLINNLVTRAQFRAIVLGLFVGLVIEAGVVIAFFQLGIGTETTIYSGLYAERETPSRVTPLTLVESQSGEGSHTARSAGTFGHPAEAAYYLEFIIPIALAYLVTARGAWDRILFAGLFASGCVALYLTFSRAGLMGLIGGGIIFFAVARWSRLISRRAFAWCVLIFVMSAVLIAPIVIASFWSRPESFTVRLELLQIALSIYWQHPILPLLGAGLSNSSHVIEDAKDLLSTGFQGGGGGIEHVAFHNHYFLVLTESGLLGFLLFFAFIWQIIAIALRTSRVAETEMKLLLVGSIAALASIAVHNLGDGFGSHAPNALLWIFAALIVAIARRVQTERSRPASAHGAAIVQ